AIKASYPSWVFEYFQHLESIVRSFFLSATTSRCFINDDEVEDWIRLGITVHSRDEVGLFAYPGQSNMTGRRLPLSWSARIRESSHGRTFTLLDAAALATTSPLDLSDPAASPDFVSVSFYKIFGFPDVGALIIRKAAGHLLQRRRYFGGGTIDMVIAVGCTSHVKRDSSLHDQLEDGTLPFLSIFALDIAIDVHARLFTSMARISSHTAFLASYLYNNLQHLHHENGSSLLRIYTDDASSYGNPALQGATIAFNVYTAEGKLIPCQVIEELADNEGIYIRSGSLCNPGGIATYLGYTPEDLKRAFALGNRCSKPLSDIDGNPTGVVRVSLGAMSTRQDVDTLVSFLIAKVLPIKDQDLVWSDDPTLENLVGYDTVSLLEAVKLPSPTKHVVERVAMKSVEELSPSGKSRRLARLFKIGRFKR
ncbi:PLP-dependent transferase, partial [Aureobasidium pullulans]